jgi:hypothetical protein
MKRIRRFSKRTWVLAGVVAVIAAMASVGAYAYWTSSGDGTGTASTGTSDAFNVTQLAPSPTNLVPGGPAQDVKINVENDQSFNQYLTSLTFEVDPAWVENDDVGDDWPPCTAADFDLVQPTVNNVDLIPGNHFGPAYTGTIQLKNTPNNQNNCKGVSVDLLLHAD